MGSDSSKNKLNFLILESQTNNYNSSKNILRIEPKTKEDNEEIENINNFENINEKDDEIFQEDLNTNQNNKINNINKYPENCIGILEFEKDKIKGKGTASLISENIVLTSASNIYDFETKKFFSNISYKHSNGKIYKDIDFKKITKNYGKNHLDEDNWAIIIFKSKISNYYLGIDYQEIDSLPSIEINIYGYNINGELFYGVTNAETQSDNTITYKFPCVKGENGAPLIKKVDNKYYIFGLNISCNEKNQLNYGNIFEKDTIKLIYYIKEKKRKFIDESTVISLDLSNKNLNCNDMKNFEVYQFSNIIDLNLANNNIKDKGIKNIINSRLQSLKKLNLESNDIGDEGLSVLFQCNFRTLNELELSNNNISEKGIIDLCKCDFKHTLIKLNLSENPKIGDKGIKNLVNVNWEKLENLIIIQINLTNKGLQFLTKTNIITINMNRNKITIEAENIINSLKLDNKQIITGISKIDNK